MTSELIQRALETATDTKSIVAGRGVISQTGRVFTDCFGDAHAIIVADQNTWAAAGDAVQASLEAAGVTVESFAGG